MHARMSQLAVDYVANKSVAPLSIDEVVRVSHKCKVPPFGHKVILAREAHYSTFDLNSGFWQVPMDKEYKQYTAFTLGSMGLYECESMPFGLYNTPPTFQQLMQNCLGELNLIYCLIYLDDVIVFSKMPEEHLQRMCVVFDRL